MTRIVHVIDRSCGADAVLEASLLVRAEDRLLCIGPPPDPHGLLTGAAARSPLEELPASKVGRRVPGRLKRLLGGNAGCLCWSLGAVAAIEWALCEAAAPLVLRAGSPPGPDETRDLFELAEEVKLTLACPTESIAAKLRGANLPADVQVIPPAAGGPQSLRPEGSAVRQRLGVRPEEILVAAPGAVDRRSGHRFAVWAAAVLIVAELPVRVLIQHTGRRARDVADFARRAGFGEQTLLDDAPLPEVVAAADVAAFLDERAPPPMALATAMAAGLPIIAADSPAAGEWLVDGVSGLLVQPGKPRPAARALLRMIEEDGLAARLGEAARFFAEERFDVESVRRQWDGLYAALATGPGSSGSGRVEPRPPAGV